MSEEIRLCREEEKNFPAVIKVTDKFVIDALKYMMSGKEKDNKKMSGRILLPKIRSTLENYQEM
jgi:hypothetical protein